MSEECDMGQRGRAVLCGRSRQILWEWFWRTQGTLALLFFLLFLGGEEGWVCLAWPTLFTIYLEPDFWAQCFRAHRGSPKSFPLLSRAWVSDLQPSWLQASPSKPLWSPLNFLLPPPPITNRLSFFFFHLLSLPIHPSSSVPIHP